MQHAANSGHRQPGRGQEHAGAPPRRTLRPAADPSRPRVFSGPAGSRCRRAPNGGSASRTLVRRPAWVMDGNYSEHLRPAGAAGRRRSSGSTCRAGSCLARVVWRVVRNYGRRRPDLGRTASERFDWSFHALDLVLSDADAAEDACACWQRLRPDQRVFVLRSRAEIPALEAECSRALERPPDRCRPSAPRGP